MRNILQIVDVKIKNIRGRVLCNKYSRITDGTSEIFHQMQITNQLKIVLEEDGIRDSE